MTNGEALEKDELFNLENPNQHVFERNAFLSVFFCLTPFFFRLFLTYKIAPCNYRSSSTIFRQEINEMLVWKEFLFSPLPLIFLTGYPRPILSFESCVLNFSLASSEMTSKKVLHQTATKNHSFKSLQFMTLTL